MKKKDLKKEVEKKWWSPEMEGMQQKWHMERQRDSKMWRYLENSRQFCVVIWEMGQGGLVELIYHKKNLEFTYW